MKRLPFALLPLLALLAHGAAAQSPKADPAEWVPQDALFYVGVTDLDETWEQFKKCSDYKAMNDPEVKDTLKFIKLFDTFGEKLRARLAKTLDVEPAQLKNPFKGGVAVYLSARAADLETIEPGLVAGVGDAEAMKKYYDAAVRKLKEQAGKYEGVSVGSNTIDVFTTEKKSGDDADEDGDDEDFEDDLSDFNPFDFTDEDAARFVDKLLDQLFAKKTMPESLALCLTDERLIVAANPDQVRLALRREEGASLADSDDYKTLTRTFKQPGTLRLLVNLPRIFTLAREANKDDEDYAKWMKTLGVDSLRSVIGHAAMGGDDFESKLELLVLTKSERSGLTKLLSMENRPLSPPAHIGADTLLFSSLNLNLDKLFTEIESMLRQTEPETADAFRQGLEAMPMPPDGTPINLRKEFIEHLKEPLTVSFGFRLPFSPTSGRMLLSLGHRDRDAMMRFLNKFQGMLAPRDFRDTQVFDVVMPPVPASVAAGTDRLFAGGKADVESALDSDKGQPLADDATWKRMAKIAPPEAWFTIFSDDRRMLEAALELAKHKDEMQESMNPGLTAIAGLVSAMTAAPQDKPDAARVMLKYAKPSILTISTTSDGILLTVVEGKPSAE